MSEAISTKRASWRIVARRVGVVIGLALAVLLGIVAGAAAFFAAALVTSRAIALGAAALAACFVVAGGAGSLAARGISATRRGRAALGVAAGTTLFVALLGAATILRPIGPPAVAADVPADVRYWDLSTGSRIAYLRIPAAGSARATPVIRLHGGPGAYAVANPVSVSYYGRLAQDGYDVYVYDQVGGGLSARLDNPQEYTIMRHVEDLEAIRKETGAERVVLMSESYGATIAANYMAVYPDRVARAIFSSPAPINPAEWGEYQNLDPRVRAEQQRQLDTLMRQPRFLVLLWLMALNPRAAHNLVPDRELDGWMDTMVAPGLALLACDPAHSPAGTPHGFGFWANMMIGKSFKNLADNPRTKLSTNQTPVLILRGECDHIRWDVTYQYRTTFPESTLLYFPRAGHAIYYDQAELYLSAVRAFLLDQPLPLAPYTGNMPP